MRAVLFDLDGTLLDIDLALFLRVYFGALGPVIATVTGSTPAAAIEAVIEATNAMMEPHPDETNRQVFDARFTTLTGVDLRRQDGIITDFYTRVFPGLGAGLGPTPGARRAVETAADTGLLVAIATNPIFPSAAVIERIRWAGLDDVPFDLVTTYEIMHACKPDPAYFLEAASMLGVEAGECLMVGDDPVLDLGAAHAGMRTYFVGPRGGKSADYRGSLDQLADLLPKLSI